MKIRSLTLKNFRGFEDATVDLDRPLTVLFGVNGSGKSSVLVAATVAASRGDRMPQSTDIRVGAGELALTVSFSESGASREIAVRHSLGQTSSTGFAPRPDGGSLLAFYDESRPLTFGSLLDWFKAREDIENELKVSRQDFSIEDPQLSAIRRAIAGMLPGFSGLRIQRQPLHMTIRKGDTTLAIDSLSGGEKLLVTLAADLARRLAIAYADHGDPLQGEAAVLIDEIELHLHPAWQRRVLAALRTTFPNCQFIVTTHSPQVLSEVPNDAVVLVDGFHFVRPGAPTAGRDSNAILAEAMGTPERPAAQLDAIHAISALLDEGKHAEARVQLDALARELSERDHEVVGLRTMLHFLEGDHEAHPQGG